MKQNKSILRKRCLIMAKTQKEFFNDIIVMAQEMGREDIVDFAKKRIEVLERKTGSKKPTKTQAENATIKETILSVMSDVGMTVTEIQAKDDTLADLSNQKVSALLRQLVEAGKVVKTTDKKKSFFALAD
jgi:hypothetical protein